MYIALIGAYLHVNLYLLDHHLQWRFFITSLQSLMACYAVAEVNAGTWCIFLYLFSSFSVLNLYFCICRIIIFILSHHDMMACQAVEVSLVQRLMQAGCVFFFIISLVFVFLYFCICEIIIFILTHQGFMACQPLEASWVQRLMQADGEIISGELSGFLHIANFKFLHGN